MNIKALINWQRRVISKPDFRFYGALRKSFPGARFYLVGGVVRDLLLKREIKDLDFVVTGVSEAKLIKFLKKYGRVDLVGRVFGVIKFTPKGKHGREAMDIALPRLDRPGHGTGAYKDVKVQRRANLPIEEDLVRRDFTVNALAWSLDDKKLIDIGKGLDDLKRKYLRTVGDPRVRFKEDYSRLLRGIRFAIQLGFDFEPGTRRVLKEMTARLNHKTRGVYIVPREVIAREFLRAFLSDPVKTIELYDKTGALRVLMTETQAMKTCQQPKPYHMEGSVWKHSLLALRALNSPAFRHRHPEPIDAELLLTIFLHDIGKPATLKTPRQHGVDRVRFNGHDVAGGKIAKNIIDRLKLSSMPVDGSLHINPEHVEWLIKHHLILLHDAAKQMKLTTIERYFIKHPLALKLRQLILADSLATVPKEGRPVLAHLNTLNKIIDQLESSGKRKLPEPLMGGDDIMGALGIESGPTVGRLKRQLREQQLLGNVKTRSQAMAYIKKANV